ncbi:tyrosine decarboxylase 1-like protein [Tanacetum coccineum]|uniref:Tyrosine decarboxylase 1-like protein n=1 Tax=Tanacetum coccineum TaxID=301880 RepID=A0ABQ5DQB0_9ASTR
MSHMIIDFLADYFQNIENYPVRSQVNPGYLLESLPDHAPMQPESIETILKDVHRNIIPGITHWQSPNFFAHFASSGSTASFIVVMEWLSKLLQLPKSFSFSSDSGGGVLHSTTCEAFVCTLLAAKEKILDQIGRDYAEKLVVYCSDQTHFSFQKSVKIVGINPKNIRHVLTSKSTNFQLSPQSLDEMIKRDVEVGLVPMYLCATVGTTSTTAVDPLGPLTEVASAYNMWVHVDAAYAGSACICPEFRHFLNGIEGASSFSFNAHIWLLTNLACCCLWVKDKYVLTKPLTTNSEYLKNKATDSGHVVDYKDADIITRVKPRSKLWMLLRSYGATDTSMWFVSEFVPIGKKYDYDPEANEFNEKLLESVNATGCAYMTHSVVGGVYFIRFAVGATLTEDRHVAMAWELVKNQATSMLYTPTPKL